MTETIPDQTSNAGPVSRRSSHDWRDYLDFASDAIRAAEKAETVYHELPRNNTPQSINRDRIAAIDSAIELLQKAKEELCR